MSIEALVEPLTRVALFHTLHPMQVMEIARGADRIIFRPGETIIRENSPGDAAFLIFSGEAVRTHATAINKPAELLPAGALVGEMAMLIDTHHTSTVVAKTLIRALRITRDRIRFQMMADPSLADHFVQHIRGRLDLLAAELRAADNAVARENAQPRPVVMPPPLPPHARAPQQRQSQAAVYH